MEKIVFKDKFELFDEVWAPRIVAQSNGQLVKIAKGNGELVWHQHDDEDELFFVFQGELTIQLRDKDIVLNAGEMVVIPKGVEHCPKATPDTHFMMIEPASTKHTGDIASDHTLSLEEQEWI